MIASMLCLTRSDIKALRIKDDYSIHRAVYSLYADARNEVEKRTHASSGFLYADKGGDWNNRRILMLSNRSPGNPEYGQVQSKAISDVFLQYDHYSFEVIINPTKREKQTGKITAIRGAEKISQWFIDKALKSWGFKVDPKSLQIQNLGVKIFEKKGDTVTLGSATLLGKLTVVDRTHFVKSFKSGIGRGKAFGFGLLQIVPLLNPFNF